MCPALDRSVAPVEGWAQHFIVQVVPVTRGYQGGGPTFTLRTFTNRMGSRIACVA